MLKKLWFIIISLILIGSFVFSACDDKEPPQNQPSDTKLKLNFEMISLQIGETFTLSVNTSEPIKWNSSDENVAAVSDGVVTAIKEGTARIYAKVGNVTLACEVQVFEPPIGVAVLILDKAPSTAIYAGYDLEINPSIKIGHEIQDISAITFTWTSSDEEVAAVQSQTTTGDAAGIIRGIAEGTTKITVECEFEGQTLKAELSLDVISIQGD